MSHIYEKDAFLLRVDVGTAEGDEGKFEMSLINGVLPAVKDMNTGRTFVLHWQDIAKLAIDAGVSEEPTQ
ncbi:MAG TPA: hypothetical protein VGT79_02750 [Xanthomonadaceae bacterium]|nr:hypothetical protein [Xanthomonadaceae bacterium]